MVDNYKYVKVSKSNNTLKKIIYETIIRNQCKIFKYQISGIISEVFQ